MNKVQQINRDLRVNLRARIKQAALDYSDLAMAADIDRDRIFASIITDLLDITIYIVTSWTKMTPKEFGDACASQFERKVKDQGRPHAK